MGIISIDQKITLLINGFSGQILFFDIFFVIITNDYLIPVISALSLFYLWFSGTNSIDRYISQKFVITGISSIVFSNIIVLLSNLFWLRYRPYETLDSINLLFYRSTDPSFPSNPVVVCTGIFFVITFRNKIIGILGLVLSLILGFSKIYLGVSFSLDVVGGFLLGILSGFFSFLFINFFYKFIERILRFVKILGLN